MKVLGIGGEPESAKKNRVHRFYFVDGVHIGFNVQPKFIENLLNSVFEFFVGKFRILVSGHNPKPLQ